MTDIAELLSDLEDLKRARRTGARRVLFGSGPSQREVEYRSDREMATAISTLESEVAALQGTAKPPTVVLRTPANRGW